MCSPLSTSIAKLAGIKLKYIIIVMLNVVMIVADSFNKISPTLWMRTGQNVLIGVDYYELRLRYTSPCDQIIVPKPPTVAFHIPTKGYVFKEDIERKIRSIVLKSSR